MLNLQSYSLLSNIVPVLPHWIPPFSVSRLPRIALISGSWTEQHPALRILKTPIEEMKDAFDVTYIQLIDRTAQLNHSIANIQTFVKRHHFQWDGTEVQRKIDDLKWLAEQKFDIIFYPVS